VPPAGPKDSVKIVSISPESCVAGALQKITVRVGYTLGSCPQGIIQLGFNLHTPGTFNMVGRQRIGPGSGEIELSAMIAPTVPAEGNRFKAFVDLSPDPHPSNWLPLATATKPLEVK